VSPEEELAGLDITEHGGNAYPDFEVMSYGGTGLSTTMAGMHTAPVKAGATSSSPQTEGA